MIRLNNASFRIKQKDADPTSPGAESAWVLRTVGSGGTTAGVPIGLLLLLTYAFTSSSVASTYQFSYRTKEGTTKRVALT